MPLPTHPYSFVIFIYVYLFIHKNMLCDLSNERILYQEFKIVNFGIFLSATEYHSDADYNSRRVGVVVVVVVITDFKKWITFLCFDRFGLYLVGSCTRVRRFTSYPIFVIRLIQPAQPAYRPKSEKRA